MSQLNCSSAGINDDTGDETPSTSGNQSMGTTGQTKYNVDAEEVSGSAVGDGANVDHAHKIYNITSQQEQPCFNVNAQEASGLTIGDRNIVTNVHHVHKTTSQQDEEKPSFFAKVISGITLPYKMKKLKTELLQKAIEVHGKREWPIKLEHAIDHVTLQLSTNEQLSVDENSFEGHLNKRNDFEKLHSTPKGNVKLENIFAEAHKLAEKHSVAQGNQKARNQYIDLHGNTVALTGEAGMGKSTLSRWLVQLITEKKMFPECEYLFYVQFRDIDFEPKISFLKLGLTGSNVSWQSASWLDEEVLKKLGDGSKVAIIFDGLDEANTDAFSFMGPLPNPGGLASAAVHIKHLLLGNLLPKAKKLFTSRPRQFLDLHPDLRPLLVVNILGLDKEAQKDICRQICRDSQVFDRVHEFLENNPDISSLCYVPALCILIDYVLSRDLADGDSTELKSLTGAFIKTLFYFASSKHVRGKHGDLTKLSKLAWNGFLEGKLTFTEKDVKESGINPNSIQDFLTTSLGKESNCAVKFLEGTKNTSFSHLTWQELFTAIHAVISLPAADFKAILPRLPESKWEIVAKFIFGLCERNISSMVAKIFNLPTIHLLDVKRNWLIELATRVAENLKSDETGKLLTVSSWLHELNDDNIGSKVLFHLPEQIVLHGNILPSDLTSLVDAFRLGKQSVRIHANKQGVHFFQDSLEILLRLLQKANVEIDVLDLSIKDLKDKHLQDAIESCANVIQESKVQITYFDMRGAVVGEHVFSKCMQHVDKVHLSSYRISMNGMEKAEDVSFSSKALDEIKSTIYMFDSELKDVKCNLEVGDFTTKVLSICWHQETELDMQRCGLQAEHVRVLASVISHCPQQLRCLNLSHNDIRNNGISMIASCVGNVESLKLANCGITEVDELTAVIATLPQPVFIFLISFSEITCLQDRALKNLLQK